jgi:hypothetical protein
MPSLRPQDRASLCRFIFADGRQCPTPRSPNHAHLRSGHARKDSGRAADELARDLSYSFSGEYLSACDFSAALGRLLPAVVRGDIKRRPARYPRLSLPNSRPNHPSFRGRVHQRPRHRLLAQSRPQFRPPELRPPPRLPPAPKPEQPAQPYPEAVPAEPAVSAVAHPFRVRLFPSPPRLIPPPNPPWPILPCLRLAPNSFSM